MEVKICNTCNIEKLLSCFEHGKNNRKGKITIYYYNKCKDCNREQTNAKNRKSKSRNRQKNRDYQKQFVIDNPEYVEKYQKEYYLKNKDKIIKKVGEYTKKRRKTDPLFRLKESISANIRGAIKKNNRSTFKILPYSVEELKNHLEKQFEPWMNWDNYGTYRLDIWDDNNSDTWSWQVDHIIPHSKFQYISIEDDEFKKCWSLENLRPYSSKQNIIKGNRNVL